MGKIIRIKSKPDVNGNAYCLEVDTDAKTVKSDYFLFSWGDYATVQNKKTVKAIETQFIRAGFTKITD